MCRKYVPIVLIILSFVLGVYFYPILPDKIITHWNAAGQADAYSPKTFLFMFPVMLIFLHILFLIIPRIDPLRRNIRKFVNYFNTFRDIVLGFIFYIYLVVIHANLWNPINMTRFVIPPLAVLFYYSGILLEKAKRNWFVGIKTPWTLSNNTVWRKTHKLGAKLFRIYAVLILVSFFLPAGFVKIVIMLIIPLAIFLVLYSYLLYRNIVWRR